MTERHLSSFLDQAVNGEISFETLLTLLRIASETNCHSVRYLMPPPQGYGCFMAAPETSPIGIETWVHQFNEPKTLSLNELCEAAHVVVLKIAHYHNSEQAALTRATNAERNERLANAETERVTDLLRAYAPHLFRIDDDDNEYLP